MLGFVVAWCVSLSTATGTFFLEGGGEGGGEMNKRAVKEEWQSSR